MSHAISHPRWLAALLSDGEVYEVGGSVRDRLLSTEAVALEFRDTDYLVRGIGLQRVREILKPHGTVSLVGKSFGVIKFTPKVPAGTPPATYDIALPRRERSTGAGHAEFDVDCDPNLPLEDDLGRRDFTINAMASDCGSGAIIDPFHGREDLDRRVLRIVFAGAFTDDPLRILRGVQFAARFDLSIDPDTLAAMREAAPLVQSVSRERIADELTKLLTLAPRPSRGFRMLHELGIMKLLIPELTGTVGVEQPGGFHAYNVFDHSLHTLDAAGPSLRLRWAALLHDINKPQCKEIVGEKATFYGHDRKGSHTARHILRRLRYPRELADQVALLVDKHMFTSDVSDKGVRRLIRKMGQELIYDLLELRRADVIAQGMGGTSEDIDVLERRITEEIERKRPFGRDDLAINGRDLMAELGLPPGPDLGRLLEELVQVVLDDPERNTRASLLSAARKSLADKGRELT